MVPGFNAVGLGLAAGRPAGSGSEAITLNAAVQRRAAQAERLGGLMDIAAGAFERGAHQNAFGFIERQGIESGEVGRGGSGAQAEITGADLLRGSEEHGALDGMLQ